MATRLYKRNQKYRNRGNFFSRLNHLSCFKGGKASQAKVSVTSRSNGVKLRNLGCKFSYFLELGFIKKIILDCEELDSCCQS